jgi:alpha/beta superfamily hydrolase
MSPYPASHGVGVVFDVMRATGRAHQLRGNLWPVADASVAAVVLHPHPKLGGDMNNNVVRAMCVKLHQCGITSLRFNTRGVGGSTGCSTWRGVSEREDVLAAVDYLSRGASDSIGGTNRCDVPKAVYIIGYSYGSAVGCSVVDLRSIVKGYVAISYPCGWMSWLLLGAHFALANTDKPKVRLCASVQIIYFNQKLEPGWYSEYHSALTTSPSPHD